MQILTEYDNARSAGRHGVPSIAQPSNPRAFLPRAAKASQRPSALLDPVLLANTIGVTERDRRYLGQALADAAKQIRKPKITTATLAREVYEGPEFADVLAGGPLPDRDEFKDRFVAGLGSLLKTKYPAAQAFHPDRQDYASGPRYDPKAAAELEAAVVPTSACLRCHDVRPVPAKGRVLEPIPALAFDPFDKTARADWVRTADDKRKQEVLARYIERLHTDADMPPEDAPEHDLFRVKQAAAFDEVKTFLQTELDKAKTP